MTDKSDIENIRECLEYSSETGIIRRKIRSGRAKAGTVAGCVGKDGYISTSVRGKLFMCHRIAWLLHFGCWPKQEIDHKNRIKSDNRISNLRDVSHFENQQNMPHNKTGAVGVYWHEPSKNWRARIGFRKKMINLGMHKKFESAAKIRREAESYYHGINNPCHSNTGR